MSHVKPQIWWCHALACPRRRAVPRHAVSRHVHKNGRNSAHRASKPGNLMTMVLERSERELVEACQRGDSEGFRALFELYRDRVYSIALRYSGDEAAAMDIAQ